MTSSPAELPAQNASQLPTEHAAVQRVLAQMDSLSVPCQLTVLEESAHTAALAAAALGTEVGQIANSLIFDADGEPLLVMTSGAHRVDVGKVASVLGVSEVRRASAEFVKRHTAQAIGGVAPIGHPRPITTLVDTWLRRYPQIWAAAGHPRTVFPTTYDDLVLITHGTPADVDA